MCALIPNKASLDFTRAMCAARPAGFVVPLAAALATPGLYRLSSQHAHLSAILWVKADLTAFYVNDHHVEPYTPRICAPAEVWPVAD